MSATAQEFVQRYLDLFSSRQLATFFELFRTDVIFHDPLGPGGILHGLDNFKLFIETLFANSSADGQWTVDAVLDAGDHIAWRGTYAAVLSTGEPLRFSMAEFLYLVDGKIQEGWTFFDQTNLQQPLGITTASAPTQAAT
jgi:ketosteroid isomerase-like protein